MVKQKNNFIDTVRKTVLASGGTIDKFNVRQLAINIGWQYTAAADLMQAIYGTKQFALTTDLRYWGRAFIAGDCDAQLATGDPAAIMDALANICWHATASGFSVGVDVQAAANNVLKKKTDESGI